MRKERLELSRVTPLAPKASASTIPPLSRPRNAHESGSEGIGNYTEDRHRPTCAGPTERSNWWQAPTAVTAALGHSGHRKISRRPHYDPINTCYRRTRRAARHRRLCERAETHRRTGPGPFAGGSGRTKWRAAICECRSIHGPQQAAAGRLGSEEPSGTVAAFRPGSHRGCARGDRAHQQRQGAGRATRCQRRHTEPAQRN